ncbi:ester cyclase [Janthinobacterium sp.]|uniref:ester cyclase n=1 Tax=Janthinobacterium sp. TaxID=1871054 RepID=UPI00293D4667|nr:ester cyclase [Janthinobacterium sp.]
MKTKLLHIASVALASALVVGQANAAAACGKPLPAVKAIALVKNFYAAFSSKNKDQLDLVLAKDWVDVPMAPGQQPGRDGMKGALDHYYTSFPDINITNEDFIVQGNKVVVRSTIRATQQGNFVSIPASNKAIQIMAIDVHEICNGKVVQTWHVEDWLSGMFEMGALPLKKN